MIASAMSSGLPPGRMPAPSLRFVPAPRVVAERAGEEWFLLDPTTGRTFRLAGVASFAWERLDGSRSLGDLADEVAVAFDVERATAAADLEAFAADMLGAGLLQSAGEPE